MKGVFLKFLDNIVG